MIYAIAKDNETSEKLLGRFKKAVHNSRMILLIRDKKYNKKPLTKRQIRVSALKRESYRDKRRKEALYS